MDPKGPPAKKSNSPKEGKAQEGLFSLPVQMLVRKKDVCRVLNPEVEVSANHKRVAASARMYDSADGKCP